MAHGKDKTSAFLHRGEAVIASIAAATGLLIVGVIVACTTWSMHLAEEALRKDRAVHAESLTKLLSTAVEPLLRAGDLSAARRVLVEARDDARMPICRIVLPDGRVIADADPRRIDLPELPRQWLPTLREWIAPETAVPVTSTKSRPIDVGERGQVYLQLGFAEPAATLRLLDFSGPALIAAGALIVMLMVYRELRKRIRSLALIRDALLSHDTLTHNLPELRIHERHGAEAIAWNRLIDRACAMQQAAGVAKARQALGGQGRDGAGDNGDLLSVVESLTTGVLVVGPKLQVRAVNGAAASLLGSTREALCTADITRLLPSQDVVAAVRAVAGGAGERRSFELDRSAQSKGVLRINVRPLRRDDDGGGALITIEDITQQRIADASRNSFVAQATHELRAPLTNMRLCLEAALDDDKPTIEAVTKHLNVLNGEARRLERLVGEMLSVAEIEAGSLSLKNDDVRLDKLVEDLRADYEPAAKDKQLTLTFELPPKLPVLHGDRDKLATTLHNLLNNAMKYTPSGGRVTFTAREEPGRMVIDVADSGIGISEPDQARIFEKFFRASDPRVGKVTGSGLGLALAREVARLHGGDLSFRSQLDRGTTFTLHLPLAQQPAASR